MPIHFIRWFSFVLVDPTLAACEDKGENFFITHPNATTLAPLATFAKQWTSSAESNDDNNDMQN
jgi:hypothetical protein